MKIVTVTLREQRISPKKARLCVDLIRSKNAELAQDILTHTNKKGARLVLNLLKSGLDACKSKDYKSSDVFISEAVCQEGRRLNRFLTSARGRSRSITHRMSHLKLTLSKIEKEQTKKDEPESKKADSVKVNEKAQVKEKVKKDGTKS